LFNVPQSKAWSIAKSFGFADLMRRQEFNFLAKLKTSLSVEAYADERTYLRKASCPLVGSWVQIPSLAYLNKVPGMKKDKGLYFFLFIIN